MTLARAESDLEAPTAVLANYLRRSISISELLRRIWSGKFIIVGAMVLGMAFGAWKANMAGPQYLATASISPADSDLTGGGGLGASSLLADFTGASNASVVPKFTQFLTAIYSVGAAKNLEARYGVICKIYRGECNQVTHKWSGRRGLRAWLDGLLANIGRLPDPNGPRTVNDLADYIGVYVTTESNKRNAIVVLSFMHPDPQFAQAFLASLIGATNDYVKLLNHDTQRRYVDYLAQASVKTTNVQQRQTIDTLLLQQERQLMMTEVDAPYAATILDGPNLKPVNRVARIIMLYGALGLMLGSVFVLFRHLIPRRARRGA